MTNIEQRLQRLKPATEKLLGEPLEFTEQHMQSVRAMMHKSELKQSILALLSQPKCSSDVTQLLYAKNETLIVQNEGIVLTILHELENDGFVQAITAEDGVKRYIITKKGLLQQASEHQKAPLLQLGKLWQEVRGQ